MAAMDGTHSQTPNPPLSSVDKIYLPRFLPQLALEDNRSSQIKRNSKRKLEDYLDPVLLNTISSRISRTETKEKHQMEGKVVFVSTNHRSEFDWPIDRLDSLIYDPNRVTARDFGVEDNGERLYLPTRSSLSKRRRSDFPMWKVDDSNHGAS